MAKSLHILFGFDNKEFQRKISAELNDLDIEMVSDVRVSKELIIQYIKKNSLCKTAVLLETTGNMTFTEEDIEALTEERELNIIMVCAQSHEGDSYMQALLSAGITSALFDRKGEASVEKITELILKKRSRKEAKVYYGLGDGKVIPLVSGNSVSLRKSSSYIPDSFDEEFDDDEDISAENSEKGLFEDVDLDHENMDDDDTIDEVQGYFGSLDLNTPEVEEIDENYVAEGTKQGFYNVKKGHRKKETLEEEIQEQKRASMAPIVFVAIIIFIIITIGICAAMFLNYSVKAKQEEKALREAQEEEYLLSNAKADYSGMIEDAEDTSSDVTIIEENIEPNSSIEASGYLVDSTDDSAFGPVADLTSASENSVSSNSISSNSVSNNSVSNNAAGIGRVGDTTDVSSLFKYEDLSVLNNNIYTGEQVINIINANTANFTVVTGEKSLVIASGGATVNNVSISNTYRASYMGNIVTFSQN